MVSSLHLPFWVVSLFPVRYLIFTPKTLIFTPESLATRFPHVVPRTVRGWRGGGGGGVPWVEWRHSWPRTHFYAGVRFNPQDQFLIPDPSPAPFVTGDWGVKLREKFVSRTSRLQLWFDCLLTPVLAKGVCPFFLP